MVVCRGPGSGDLGGCTIKVLGKRAGTMAPTVRCQPYWATGTGYCSASELSSSESMSGGSSSSKNMGRSLGVYFSPVNVKAPEPLMNSERAAMPLGVPRSSAVLFDAPQIPAGMHQFRRIPQESTGIHRNPVEWNQNPVEWNQNPVEWNWNPAEWAWIPLDCDRRDLYKCL